MSDKKQDIFQFLNELREKCRSLTNEKDIFENGVIKVPIEDLDKLIGIVEQMKQTNEKIKRYEKALKTIAEHQYYGSIGAIGYYAEFKSIAKQALGESE